MSDDDAHGRRDGLRLAMAILARDEAKWAALLGEASHGAPTPPAPCAKDAASRADTRANGTERVDAEGRRGGGAGAGGGD